MEYRGTPVRLVYRGVGAGNVVTLRVLHLVGGVVVELITRFFLGFLRGVVLIGKGVVSHSHCESSETVAGLSWSLLSLVSWCVDWMVVLFCDSSLICHCPLYSHGIGSVVSCACFSHDRHDRCSSSCQSCHS